MRRLAFLALIGASEAMLTGPNATGTQRSLWDQEGFIDVGGDGTWHIWYDNDYCKDGKRGAGISNYGHFTSSDGVHWTDHGIGMSPWSVCPCGTDDAAGSMCATNASGSGPVAGIGSGSAWAVPGKKGKYVINYSTNKKGDSYGQEISFSTADSPMGPWTPATNVPAYHEDGTHFKKGRWDTIMQFTHEGVMHGWWTATPADGSVGFGYGTTTDGLHWTTNPPAKVNLPGLSGTQLEVGGVARLPNGKWYAHACAIAWGHVDGLGGCFNVVADGPGGPYNKTEKNWALLAYAAADGIPAYFSRPYLGPDGISLVNFIHGPKMSTLKHASVADPDGVLRWVWWEGNEKLRGPAVPLAGAQATAAAGPCAASPCALVVDSAHGTIVEGEITWGSDPNTAVVFGAANASSGTADGAAASGGFGRLSAGGKGQPWSTLDLGKGTGTGPIDGWKNSSHQGLTAAAPEPTRGLRFKAGDKVSWRLLVRQNLWEIYFAPAAAAGGKQTFYFGAAYDATCTKGKQATATMVELHGAFASSGGLAQHTMTLDTHDFKGTC